MRAERYTRDARPGRAKAIPDSRPIDYHLSQHYGDEFDEEVPDDLSNLRVAPVREYTPKVKQKWDMFADVDDVDVRVPASACGPLVEDMIPVVTSNSDFSSFLAAFDKRSNSQPDADDDCTTEFMVEAAAVWTDVFKKVKFDTFDITEDVVDRWMAKLDPVKQQRMSKALDGLWEVEDDSHYLGEKNLFVKVEALLKRYDQKWAPRLIYQGNDSFNALTGPVAMVICERLVELFATTKVGPLEILMAYKTDDTALSTFLCEAPEKGYKEGFEADFSANDLRQRAGATRVFGLVCRGLGAPEWFITLLEEMRVFTVRNNKFGLKAELENQLPTGTTITTPRNTVWNVTIEAVHAKQERNEGRGVCLGDDWYAMMRKRVAKSIESWVAEHPKMKLTAAWTDLSGEATFLSRRICVYGETPCMIPKIGKALARFNARASKNASISDSAYMAGKALSYAYEFRHFPMFRTLFLERYMMEEDAARIPIDEVSWFTRTSGIDLDRLETAIQNEKVVVDDDQAYEFIMDAYGVDSSLIEILEAARKIVCNKEKSLIQVPEYLNIDY